MLQLRLINNWKTGEIATTAELTFLECTYIKLELDLDGKHVTGDSLSEASCNADSSLRQALEAGPMKYERDPLSDYIHFIIKLVSPGGELHLFARDFVLRLGA